MKDGNLRIEIMCPELCNLYGDMGNVDYLRASLPVDTEYISTLLTDEPAFAGSHVDMIYLGSMTERSQERIIAKLLPYKERLEQIIGDGTLILATGNAPEVFMDRIEVEDGTVIRGLGIVPYYTRRKLKERNNSLYLGKLCTYRDGHVASGPDNQAAAVSSLDIVGYTSRFTYTYGVPDGCSLFTNIKGDGNEPGSATEGFCRNGLIATNLLGPVLVLNPDLMKWVMARLGITDREPAFYKDAMKAYEIRLAEFNQSIDFGTHC